MQITINIPDDIGKQIQNLPDIDEFFTLILRTALEKQNTQYHTPQSRPSKWAKIAQRVQNDPVHLKGYSIQLQKDMKEFREKTEFNHDRNE